MTPHRAGHRPSGAPGVPHTQPRTRVVFLRGVISRCRCLLARRGPSAAAHAMAPPGRAAGRRPAPSRFFPAATSNREPSRPPQGRGCGRRRVGEERGGRPPRQAGGGPVPRSARPQRRLAGARCIVGRARSRAAILSLSLSAAAARSVGEERRRRRRRSSLRLARGDSARRTR